MAYTLVKLMLPSSKYDIKSPTTMEPTSITVHNTGSYASAKAEMNYMISNNNKVSYHYAIDDINVYQGISENRVAYHSGTRAGNYSSISIEICYSEYKDDEQKKKFLASEKNAAAFIATRLKAYGWGIDKVKRHKDWSGKNCPEKTMLLGWNRFLDMIKDELIKLDNNTIKAVDYYVEVTASNLNIRSTYSTNGSIVGTYFKGDKARITKESSNEWGYTGKGWISLAYTKKISSSTSSTSTTPVEESAKFESYKAIVLENLNYRATASKNGELLGSYKEGAEITISKENKYSTWGYTGKGWVCLKYVEKEENKTVNYKVEVTASSLNCRKCAHKSAELVTSYKEGTLLHITKENKCGSWGYTGKGWVNLTYTKKVTTKTIAKKNFAVGEYNAYVQITTESKSLNVRSKAVNGSVVDSLNKGDKKKVYTIIKGSDGNFWGSINSGGTKWICLKYATPIAYTYTV